MSDLTSPKMLIHPHNPAWPDHFRQIAKILHEAAGEHLLVIHHIGSTAVPGLAAKPIIDIDMEYAGKEKLHLIIYSLESLGYYHNGDQGIPDREVFKRSPTETPHPVLDTIPHHLYACSSESPELSRHLRFRNGLRADETARTAYEKLKRKIAILANQELKAYAEIKQEKSRELVEAIISTQP